MASSPNEDTTTISTSSSRDRGGYDVEFFENEPDDVTCSICLMVLCEPMQAEECGHRFCRTCLEELRKSNNGILVCPEDRKIINVFRDRGKEREILNYVICCTNQEKGCNWTAPLRELQEHLEACQLLSISCPRLMEGCQQSILRCAMDTHINEECLYRPVLCPFCTTQYLLAQESDHFQECLRYPVTCQHCSEENPREMFEKHVSEECTKFLHPCLYEKFGCKQKFTRDTLVDHTKDLCHLKLALEKIEEQNKTIESQQSKLESHEQQICHLNSQMNILLKQNSHESTKQTQQSTKPKETSTTKSKTAEQAPSKALGCGEFLWKLEIPKVGYPPRMLSKAMFYSSSTGYHFMIVFIKEMDSHVSILFRIIEGWNDASLQWPLKAKITISLVKGETDKNKMTFLTTDSKLDSGIFKRPNVNPQSMSSSVAVEIPYFLQHNALSSFISNNKLTIKVNLTQIKDSNLRNYQIKPCTGARFERLVFLQGNK